MRLNPADAAMLKEALNTKSTDGRFYDFESLLKYYGQWARSGIMPSAWCFANSSTKTNQYAFVERDDVLMLIDKALIKYKLDAKFKKHFLCFELYYLISINAQDVREQKEKELKRLCGFHKKRYKSTYIRTRLKLQELLRKDLLEALN